MTRLARSALCILAFGGLAFPAEAQEPPPRAEPSVKTARVPAGPASLDVLANLGASTRADDEQVYSLDSRTGLAFGVAARVNPVPNLGIGLRLEHLDLGTATGSLSDAEGRRFGSIELTRDVNALWLDFRLRFLQPDWGALYLDVAPGLAWQSAEAAGIANLGALDVQLTGFRCEGRADAAFGIRTALGAEIQLKGPVFFELSAAPEILSLSSDPLHSDELGTCGLGAGATFAVVTTGAVSVRFDLGQ